MLRVKPAPHVRNWSSQSICSQTISRSSLRLRPLARGLVATGGVVVGTVEATDETGSKIVVIGIHAQEQARLRLSRIATRNCEHTGDRAIPCSLSFEAKCFTSMLVKCHCGGIAFKLPFRYRVRSSLPRSARALPDRTQWTSPHPSHPCPLPAISARCAACCDAHRPCTSGHRERPQTRH